MRTAVICLLQFGGLVFPLMVHAIDVADVISIDTVVETASGQVDGVDFLVEATFLFPHAEGNGGFVDGEGVSDGSDISFNSPRFTPSLAMSDSLALWASSDFRITFSQPVTDFRIHIFELGGNQLSFSADGASASLSIVSSDGDFTVSPGSIIRFPSNNCAR